MKDQNILDKQDLNNYSINRLVNSKGKTHGLLFLEKGLQENNDCWETEVFFQELTPK